MQRVGDGGEPVAEEQRVGLRLGQMRGRDRRDRDVGGGERRRVVEAVADHQHVAALFSQRLQPRDLVGRLEPGGKMRDRQLARDLLDRLRPIAGQDLDRVALARQARRRLRARRGAAPGGPRRRRRAPGRERRSARRPAIAPRPRPPRPRPCNRRREPSLRRLPSWKTVTPWPGNSCAASGFFAPAASATALASGCLLASASDPASARSSGAMSAAIGEARLRQGQRSRLVEDDRVDVGEALQRVAGIEHQAAAEHRARGDHLHRRHRQAERAGTGDDQHGDRDHQRRLPGEARREPAEERRQRRQMHDRRIEPRGAIGEPDIGRALLDRLARAAR